jgi:UDP-N-acetyl-2-amino-2-deoxyglucuronate dehydrogenase
MKKIKIAVLGAGLAAAPHFKSLHELKDIVEVDWIVLRTTKRFDECRREFPHAKITTRIEDVVNDGSVDFALVLTPPNTHLEIAQILADANIHVLLEKPLEVNYLRSEKIVQIFQQKNMGLGLILQHRFRPATIELKKIINSKKIGDVLSGHVSVRWWRDNHYYSEPGRGTYDRDGGGVLITQAIHTIDLLIHVLGSPKSVYAQNKTTSVHKIEAEDLSCAIIEFENNVLVSLNATTAAPPGHPESIEISGTQGSITLKGGELTIKNIDGGEEKIGINQPYGAGKNPMDFNHGSHKLLIEDFINSIMNKTKPVACGNSTLATHQLIFAMTESAIHDKKIILSESII